MGKINEYTNLVCKGYCAFYKEGKEELLCGTYQYIISNFTEEKIRDIPQDYKPDFSKDQKIMDLICSKCEFLIDGCGYREGEGTPPCGGYTIVEWLLKHS
ncbi:MAG: hypothetical protein GXO99_04230 [Nitrospirae bacterium]|nr:hypothetical protein [Nitrospirota bacterium]